MTSRIYLRSAAALAVAFGVALAAVPSAQAQLFGSSSRNDAESAVRLNRVEEQMRALTGQIEELSHQVRQLQDQLRRSQEDTEFRFQALEGGTPGKRSQATPPAAPPTQSQGAAGTAPAGGVATAQGPNNSQQRGAPPANLGTLPADAGGSVSAGGSGRPLDLSQLAGGINATGNAGADTGVPGVGDQGGTDDIGRLVAAPSSGVARDDYDRAYNLVLAGDYAGAEQSFAQFIDEYPDDPLAANAQYWMGESFYSRGLYREAADAFLKTYTSYPETGKAPDSLLKLGLSLGQLGQGDAACATYSELLSKYPQAPTAVLNRARAEQKSARCS